MNSASAERNPQLSEDGSVDPILRHLQWWTTDNLRMEGAPAESEVVDSTGGTGFVFLIVATRIPAKLFWRQTGDSFYKGPAGEAKLIPRDGDPIVAHAWTTDPTSPFFSSTKTAFMPDPPRYDERVRFAFLVIQNLPGKSGLQFQYGDSQAVPLSEERRRAAVR